MKTVVWILVVIAIVLVGYLMLIANPNKSETGTFPAPVGSGGNQKKAENQAATGTSTQNQSSSIISGSSEASSTIPASEKSFTVTGKDFSFAPSQITVKKGDRVKITFVNAGGFHNLQIDEFNAATKRISGGERTSMEFTADKTGSFDLYCSVDHHRALGMKGRLIVK